MDVGWERRTLAELVPLAGAGGQDAWSELVRRYLPLVWAVVRAHRLDRPDADDAVQSTWIALAEHLSSVRDPDRLPGWLATTAGRESLRLHAARRRDARARLVDADDLVDLDPSARPEPQVLRRDRDRQLWRAFSGLPQRCRVLLGLLAHAPELSYVQLSRALGIAPGSVGPVRGRCLGALRRGLAGRGFDVGAAG